MFGKYPEKIALFVDAANLYYITRALGIQVDFVKFLQYFNKRNVFVAYAGYYTAIEDTDGDRPLQRLVDFLSFHGFTVISKPSKAYTQADGKTKKKGNMDIELTLDVSSICLRVDRVVLVTGDGDFTPLVNFVKSKGTQVTVVSSMQGNMLSYDLRKAATDLIDLADIRSEICTTMLP